MLAEAAASEESQLVTLPVPGFQSAVLAVPIAERPLRLMVATHGAGGDPDSTCSAWAQRTHGHLLVACPRGHAMNAVEPHGYYYPDHHKLEAEVLAVVAAIERRYGSRLADTGAIYTGFSQGATMGALFVPARAAVFSTLVLTEGGYTEWTLQSARAFRAAGGSRALFVCGTRHCATHAEQSSKLLSRVGVATRVEHVLGGGHTDRSRVGERLDTLSDWALSWQP
jgi:predicted esterase